MSDVIELFGETTLENVGTDSLQFDSRLSTDSRGVAACLGLQAEANIDLERIVQKLETQISNYTLFTLGDALLR